MKARYSALAGTLLFGCVAANAEDGALAPGNGEFNGVLVTTFQSMERSTVADETLYSLDLTYKYRFDSFGLFAWAEYAKPTRDNNVSGYSDYANADAGTISNRKGQISELYLYGNEDNDGEPGWRIGINEVTTLIDRSALANDEVEQFLSLPLVNNLSIAFPDYALSGFYQDTDAFDQFGYRLVLSSSHGLADNQELAGTDNDLYSRVLDVGADGKGVFAAVELVFDGTAYQANIGYWKNTGDSSNATYGLYAGMDYFVDNGKLNVRYGQAGIESFNPVEKVELEEPKAATMMALDVPEQFASAAWQQPLYGGELALGYTFTRFNQVQEKRDVEGKLLDVARSKATMQTAEVYYRKPLAEKIFLTPAVQWSHGVSFDNDWLLSIRMEFGF